MSLVAEYIWLPSTKIIVIAWTHHQDNWQLKHYTRGTREVTSSHNTDNLAKELKNSIEQWKIDDKVFTITNDNASNITKAVVNELELPHLGCVGHNLQLSIEKALKLSTVVRILGQLIQVCETLWGSTYLMLLLHVQKQQPAICAVLMESKNRSVRNLFSETSEWTVIEKLSLVLSPFYDATTIMRASKYPTYCTLFLLLNSLKSL